MKAFGQYYQKDQFQGSQICVTHHARITEFLLSLEPYRVRQVLSTFTLSPNRKTSRTPGMRRSREIARVKWTETTRDFSAKERAKMVWLGENLNLDGSDGLVYRSSR